MTGTSGADLVAVSPHYDDVAFSCGATVHRAAREGLRVLVVTVCGGVPGVAADASSPVAQRLHARWAAAAGETPPTNGAPGRDLATARALLLVRRAEDEAALEILGVEGTALDVCDGIYRRDAATGAWVVPTEAALFAGQGVPEATLAWRIAAALQSLPDVTRATRFLVPLAVGNHVDHRLTRRAVELAFPLERTWYYEDVPYALATSPDGGPARGMTHHIVNVGEPEVAAKVAAAAAYTSQLTTFWPSVEAMGDALRAFAIARGEAGVPGERLWRARSASPTPILGRD